MITIDGEMWDDETVAAYLGIQVQSVAPWLHRNGIKRYRLVEAELVRAAKQGSPGQGHRSDLDLAPKARQAPVVQEPDPQEIKRLQEEALWKASRSTRM